MHTKTIAILPITHTRARAGKIGLESGPLCNPRRIEPVPDGLNAIRALRMILIIKRVVFTHPFIKYQTHAGIYTSSNVVASAKWTLNPTIELHSFIFSFHCAWVGMLRVRECSRVWILKQQKSFGVKRKASPEFLGEWNVFSTNWLFFFSPFSSQQIRSISFFFFFKEIRSTI